MLEPINPALLDADIKDILTATLNKIETDYLRQQGYSRKNAYKLLETINAKMKLVERNNLSLVSTNGKPIVSREEFDLFRVLVSVMVISPAFTGEKLFLDFRDTLKSNGLLKQQELRVWSVLSPMIQLHALCQMHRSEIVLQDEAKAMLLVSLDDGHGTGKLTLKLELKTEPDAKVSYLTPFMTTQLLSSDYCEPSVISSGDPTSVMVNREQPFSPIIRERVSESPIDNQFFEISAAGKLQLF